MSDIIEAEHAEPKNHAITLSPQGEVMALLPRNTDEVKSMVQVMVAADCVPDGYKTNNKPDHAKMAVGIMAGAEVGLGPMASLKHIYIVRGMPTMWGAAVKGKVFQAGLVTDYTERWYNSETNETMFLPGASIPIEKWPDELTRVVTATRKGVLTPFEGRFSVGDARRAGLWNPKRQTYYKYPAPSRRSSDVG